MEAKTKNVFIRMAALTALLAVLTLALFLLHRQLGFPWLLSLAITSLTFFYHLAMRLAVGEAITLLFQGKQFPQNRLGFALHGFEAGLYKKLKVKQWKTKTITAKPEQFDMKRISPQELLHNVMQAELVHRVIMVLSFVPLLFIAPFGEPMAFIITSVLASLIDLQFVIIQRYNRPRVLKLAERAEKRKT